MTQSAPSGSTSPAVFCASFELSATQWRLAFTDGSRFRQVSIGAGDFAQLSIEIEKARARFKLASDVPLHSCYESGRDGFWIHRRLVALGIKNVVVDSSSIQVDRRARRAKTDGLDATSLAKLLLRAQRGDDDVWRVVKVPTVEEEDARRIHRERERLTVEKTQHQTRIRALLALHGLKIGGFKKELAQALTMVPPLLRAEVEREQARLKLVLEQLRLVDDCREELVTNDKLLSAGKMRELERLRGLGPRSATVLVGEFFGWRKFTNGKQVGSCAGLAPTPYSSGSIEREQGISKAGSRRIRTMCIELAWGWLRYQPESRLSKWFEERFAKEGGRSRRLGIVALARKLLVALWQYTERGVIPEGAVMKA